jgi:acetoin:2,6-dichlorophenolindophenol oxidoreductase subunit alpha
VTPIDADTARALLRTMWRIRAFEERVAGLKRADELHGLIHLSVGQEAVAAAVCGHLRTGDNVYSGHRAHGHAIARGVPLRGMMAELMARSDGVCRGLGGSMHLVDTEHGLLGATGVVGGNIPMAAGTALAGRLQRSDAVTVVFFGDGAVQAGHFTETVNLAALWRLPLVLVCENNGFAEFTPRSAHTVVERVSDAVAPYGLDRATVDGNDAAAVWHEAGRILDAVREGGGPALLECLTHRLRGHYEGDPDRYRDALSADEIERIDPIQRLRDQAATAEWFTETDVKDAEQAARQAVDEAVEFARASPQPSSDLAASLVYA